jgi:hypothetical protein
MEDGLATLQDLLDREVPEARGLFYAEHIGFQDPFGEVRRLIEARGAFTTIVDTLQRLEPAVDVSQLVLHLLENVPVVPAPVQIDYRPWVDADPFPPHLVCFALVYIKVNPTAAFRRAFVELVVRTGWWAGDENCIDDVLAAVNDLAEVCRIAADAIPRRPSGASTFSASQLLYHLGYGRKWGLRDYVRNRYEDALRTLKDPEDLREVRMRLKAC